MQGGKFLDVHLQAAVADKAKDVPPVAIRFRKAHRSRPVPHAGKTSGDKYPLIFFDIPDLGHHRTGAAGIGDCDIARLCVFCDGIDEQIGVDHILCIILFLHDRPLFFPCFTGLHPAAVIRPDAFFFDQRICLTQEVMKFAMDRFIDCNAPLHQFGGIDFDQNLARLLREVLHVVSGGIRGQPAAEDEKHIAGLQGKVAGTAAVVAAAADKVLTAGFDRIDAHPGIDDRHIERFNEATEQLRAFGKADALPRQD